MNLFFFLFSFYYSAKEVMF